MSRYVWIVALSLVCGSLLMVLLGGGRSPSSVVIGGVVIVGGLAWLASAGFGPRSRGARAPGYPAAELREPQLSEQGGRGVGDGQVLLDPRSIAWIGGLEFTTAWRDDNLAPFREFGRFERERPRLSDSAIELALEELGSTVGTFLDLYDRLTTRDPLLVDRSWRMIEVDRRADVTAGGTGLDPVPTLRQGAAAIVAAYEKLQTIVAEKGSRRSARSRR